MDNFNTKVTIQELKIPCKYFLDETDWLYFVNAEVNLEIENDFNELGILVNVTSKLYEVKNC